MRVEKASIPPVVPSVSRHTEATVARSRPSAAGRTDKVQLSPLAAHAQRLERAVQHAPDTRAERVAELKARVQSGAYQVDSSVLAERLLRVL